MLLPAPSAAFDVGKKQHDRAGGPHARALPSRPEAVLYAAAKRALPLFPEDDTLKNLVFILGAALVLSVTAASVARADDVRAQIQAQYDGQCKAFLAKDATGFQKAFDPKYTSTDTDGKQQTLAEVVADATTPQAGVDVTTCAIIIRKLTTGSGTATVLATLTAAGTFAQGASTSPFVQVQESTDAWSLSGSPLETASIETGHRLTIGGKVVEEKGTMTTPASSGP
jgi:hypothetical protein